jgi:spore germination protein
VVAPGENLYRIGELYGLPWTAIADLNGISNPDQIVVGQELRLPSPPAPVSGDPTVEPAPEGPTAEATRPGTGPIGTHTVRPGDNVYRISQLYGVSWVEIAEANGLITPNQIYVGQVLKIPVSRPGPTPEFTHQVRGGETLFRIALQYGIALAALAEANGLQPPYVIYPGQTLVITSGDKD